MHLFYYSNAELKTVYNSGSRYISLTGDEAAHLKVLRMRQGEHVYLTDGFGNLCKGEIEESDAKRNVILLKDLRSFERPSHRLHIAVAPPKNIARFEWFLEKATEAGIDEITPFFSEHSERAHLRNDRLNKVIISAMKQSLKTYMPVLNEPLQFNKLIAQYKNMPNSFIAWLDHENSQPHLKTVCSRNEPAFVLIGPEGDFSQEEVNLARSNGFLPVSLGSSRLRTETAALSACFIVNILNEPDYPVYPLQLE